MEIETDKWYSKKFCDLKVMIHVIYFENEEYIKCKYTLMNKFSPIIYDNKTQGKFYKKNIKEWRKMWT